MNLIVLSAAHTPGHLRREMAARREALFKELKARAATLVALYASAGDESRKIINTHGDSDGVVGLSRVQALLRDLQTVIIALKSQEERDLRDSTSAAATLGITAFKGPLEAAGVSFAPAAASLTAVHTRTVEEIWNEALADQLKLSPRTWNGAAFIERKVRENVLQAVMRGQSAQQASLDLIREGTHLTKEVLREMGYSHAAKIGDSVFDLFTKKGRENVFNHALTVMRTEMSRSYRAAFHKTAESVHAVAGMKWNLSPAHPAQDICDDLAAADPDGLGKGCYKTGNYPSYPAHPNCFCFDTPIFVWEVKQDAA